MSDSPQMRDRWRRLCRRLRIGDCDAIFERRIVAAYTEPHRQYHTLDHIGACLGQLDTVRDRCHAPDTMELAIWFHDIVYDPRRSDNEARSTDVAAQTFAASLQPDVIQRVRQLILATQHPADSWPEPEAADADDARYIADIDLHILGQRPEAFDAYERAIRAEYTHVEDARFRRARAAVVHKFLDRPRIYRTDVFRDRYERAARANLRRSLGRLRLTQK